MNWLIFTFLAVFSRSLYGIFTKIFSSHKPISVYTQSVLIPAIAAVITLILAPFLGGIDFSSTFSLPAVSLLVLGQVAGNLIYYEAIKNLTSSTAQILFSSILVFNTIFSILFLNAHVSPKNLLGIGIMLMALILVAGNKIEFHLKGTILMITSAALFSMFQLSTAVVSKQLSAATYLIIAYLGTVLCIFAIKPKTIIGDLKKFTNLKSFLIPIKTTIFSMGALIFSYYAYSLASQPEKVTFLLPSQVVLTVLIGYIFFKEKSFLSRKLTAAVLVVLAAYLIKS